MQRKISQNTNTSATTTSISLRTPSPAHGRNRKSTHTNSLLSVTVNLSSLNSSSKDPAGYRLKSNQRLKKAAAGIAKKRKIDIAYSEASATYHEKGIGNMAIKREGH